jgi:hypothetical protein
VRKDYLLEEYYQEWLEIANDPTTHIENLKVNFLTSPAPNTLKRNLWTVDGAKGQKFNINWIG